MELQVRIVVRNPPQSPFVANQQYRVVASIIDKHASVCTTKAGWSNFPAIAEGHPAGYLIWLHIHDDIHTIFVLQPVLQHLKLQGTYCAYDVRLSTGTGLLEQLDSPLLGQLLYTLDKLLTLHGVLGLDTGKFLWREYREVLIFELVGHIAEGITYTEDTWVKKAYNISWISLIHDLPVLGQELLWLGQLDGLATATVVYTHAPLKLAGANTDKGQPVPMGRVHVSLNLENKSRKLVVSRLNHALCRISSYWLRSQLQILLQEILHAKVSHGRTKEHRSQLTPGYFFQVKLLTGCIQKVNIIHQGLMSLRSQHSGKLLILQGTCYRGSGILTMGCIIVKKLNLLFLTVIYAKVVAIGADWPVHRIGADAQHIFQLVHEIQRSLAVTVQLVDKGKDRNPSLLADLEELLGLSLNALGYVNNHDSTIHSHQCTICILREVLMAWGVQDIDAVPVVVELQYRRGNGNTTLFFYLHPV